ncbi:hypothetical protein FRC17_001300 [Serendipita sp. 399]|nr:hypothetical protein FRC17_001300 [Serendipita sp. 399]
MTIYSFTFEKPVCLHGVRTYNYGTPAPVLFEGKLYLFYSGSEEGDIWFTYYDWKMWSVPERLNSLVPTACIHPNTNPCPVVYKDRLYIFFNGQSHDGTWYTTYHGGQWTPPISITGILHNFMTYTSPSAAILNDCLHLFWTDIDKDGVHYTIFNGTKWSPCSKIADGANGIRLAKWTSPAVISKGDKLYLFYHRLQGDGTYYTILADGRWSAAIQATPYNTNSATYTSPSACVCADGSSIMLAWRNRSDYNTCYSLLRDGQPQAAQGNALRQVRTMPPDQESSPGVIFFRTVPFIFYIASDKQIWFARGPVVQLDELSHANLSPAINRLLDRKLINLTIFSFDPRAVQFFDRRQTTPINPPATIAESSDSPTVKDLDGISDPLLPKASLPEELSRLVATLIGSGFALQVRKVWYDNVHEPIMMDLAIGQPDKKLYAWIDAGVRGEEGIAVSLVRDVWLM